jgi:hypothetical protein
MSSERDWAGEWGGEVPYLTRAVSYPGQAQELLLLVTIKEGVQKGKGSGLLDSKGSEEVIVT